MKSSISSVNLPIVDTHFFSFSSVNKLLYCKLQSKVNNNNQTDINNSSKNETTHNKFSSKNSHQYNFSHNNNEHFKRKLNRPFTEREGDWICFKCKNLNFAFRTICNRCHEAKNKNGGQTRQFRHFNRNKLFV